MLSQSEISLFEPHAVVLEVGGNEPFLLSDPGRVFVVAAGKVDLFAVRLAQGRIEGTRHHVLRAEVGQALIGLSPGHGGSDVGLLAVGGAGTRLMAFSRSKLLELSAEPQTSAAATTLIETWVGALERVLRCGLPPNRYTPLYPGEEVSLQEGEVARPEAAMVWLKSGGEGSFFFGGRQEALALGPDSFFPLSAEAWIEAGREGQISCLDTAAYLSADPALTGLDELHGLSLAVIQEQALERERAGREQLQARSRVDRSLLQNAYLKIASVLGAEAEEAMFAEGEGDPLLAACRLVGRVLKIDFQPHPESKKGLVTKDPLNDIAQASRVRTRRVALKGEWWRQDNGPLLGFLKEDHRPVALLPTSPRRYVVADPTARTRLRLNAETAETLDPFAYSFYRPFPERALSGQEMIKFGFLGCRKDFSAILLLGVIVGLLGVLTPVATGIIFNEIIPNAAVDYLLQIAVILVVCYVAAALFTFARNIATMRIEGRMDATVQAAIWDRLMSLPVPFFRRYSSGDLAMRAMGVNAIRQLISGVVMTNILGSIFSVFNLVLLFYYDARLALVALGLIAVAVICTVLASYGQLRYQRRLVHIQGRIAGLVQQLVNGVVKVRVGGAEDRAFAVWADQFSEQKTQAFKAGVVSNSLLTFNAGFPVLASTAIFAWIIFRGLGNLNTGNFLAFNTAFITFLSAAIQMSASLVSILYVIPYYERLKPIIEAAPEVDEAKAKPGELSGRIEVHDVNFRYDSDGPLILEDVSVGVEPGEFVAIVGPSGSGKSTLLRLLLGFEAPEQGTIYYDNFDLATVDVREVRRQVGVVLQNAQVLPGTVFTNIVGSSPFTLDDAWEAARLAGFEEDVKGMPMSMQTMVSEGGSTLSGGQRQRLLIARALVRKPRIIFFDEATSALDNQTQAVVSRSLDSLKATRLVIAHRLSTIAHADRIIVLDKGRIVETGSYEELMGAQGVFTALAKRQLA